MNPSFSLTDRRELLRWAVASAAGLVGLPRGASSQPRWSADPFALGVASGAPGTDSVVLWTRLLAPGLGPAPVVVRWEVAHDEQFSRLVQRGQATAVAELGHSVHVEAVGLEAERWYFYRFMAGDAVSPVGRTRTLPAPGAEVQRLRLAYASCQRWEQGYFSAWRHMRDERLDAVVFLGDYIYESTSTAEPVRPLALPTALTLEGYRRRYAAYKSDVGLQAMHAACPWLVTWDDHEVQNDYAGLQPGHTGAQASDFAARRAAAYQAFYEHMPLRSAVLTRALSGLSAGAEMRIYGATRFGRLASIALLDARQYKDPQVCNPEGHHGASTLDPQSCPAWNDPARSLLGAAQERWLDGELAAQAGTTWSVVAQQTLFGRRNLRADSPNRQWNDGWDGYTAARTRLTNSLRRNPVANAVLLGGDVHENWVGQVKADYADPHSADIGVEFCGTSISSRGGTQAHALQRLKYNPHFVFADAEKRGYGVVEFTPEKLVTTLRAVDDVGKADSGISTLARFEVVAGRAVVQKE